MPADVNFTDSVLAVHIAAAVVAFGVIFAYPVLYTVIGRQDARALPALHRADVAVTRWLINPALLVLILAGVYLASHEHRWSQFFVQWGVGVALVLGGLAGSFFIPTNKRLAELAERDVGAAREGQGVILSPEYQALYRRLARVGAAASVLVLATVFFMANHVGGAG